VGEADNGAEVVPLCRKTNPHIVLMDIGLPGMNGIEATTELLRHCPGVKVVILSMYDDENSVVGAIRSGARAFVLKKASSAELLDALRTVARGGSYLSPQVSDRLLARIQRGDLETRGRSPLESLSPASCRCCGWWPRARPARYRGYAGSRPANRAQLPQDHDEEARREQRSGLTQLALAAGITHWDKPDASPWGEGAEF